jgi:hypothetical protein
MGGALDMDDAVSAVSSNSALSCANSALSTGKLSALSGLSRANSAKSVRPPPTVIRLMRSERLGFLARGSVRIRKWAPCSTSGPSDYRAEESNNLKGKVKVERQLVGLPWAADSCPWVGKLRTVLPLTNRVIRDSAVQLVLTHQRGAFGVDSSSGVV